MEAIKQEEVNGYTVSVHYDDSGACNPREWGTHGCELALSHKQYDLPNDAGVDFEHYGLEEIAEQLKDDHDAVVIVPVYGYDHGELYMKAGARTYPFDDHWDSGVLGLAYVTRENWRDTQGSEWEDTEANQAQAMRLITDDVNEYDQWSRGEVYGFTVTFGPDNEHAESCWGFTGDYDEAFDEGKSVAESLPPPAPRCTGYLDRASGTVKHNDEACPIHEEVDA